MGGRADDLGYKQILTLAQSLDCFTWLTQNKLMLGAGPWTLVGHEYQVDWLQCDSPRQVFIKGAQIGATETLVLMTLHGMIYGKYPQGAMYLFPTRDDVGDFSQTRFDPLIRENPFIGEYVYGTDRKNVKQIGKGKLYLRGARSTKAIGGSKKSSSQLKSAPVDRVVFDEMDEIEPEMVTLAKERTSHSHIKQIGFEPGEHIFLGTPTIPNHGVDAKYKESDQRVWMIRCEHCNQETCLELEFPNSVIRRTDGSVYRACIHCRKEIYPANGRWMAQYPSKSKELVGWWISQLNSVYMSPKVILDLYEDPPYGDLSEVMNSKLGMAYVPAENKLSHSDVVACSNNEPQMAKHDGPTCMGVDVGQKLNVVIAERKNRNCVRVVKVAQVESFNDVKDLGEQFNVKCAVFDLRPEIRKVREYMRDVNYLVYGCEYVEQKAGGINWDEKDHLIKCNRTEICDASHELVVNPGRLIIPRVDSEVNEFVKQMCNITKILDEDKETGARNYRYTKTGPDHYRHAMNYCLLASERIGTISDKNIISKFFGGRRRRSWLTA